MMRGLIGGGGSLAALLLIQAAWAQDDQDGSREGRVGLEVGGGVGTEQGARGDLSIESDLLLGERWQAGVGLGVSSQSAGLMPELGLGFGLHQPLGEGAFEVWLRGMGLLIEEEDCEKNGFLRILPGAEASVGYELPIGPTFLGPEISAGVAPTYGGWFTGGIKLEIPIGGQPEERDPAEEEEEPCVELLEPDPDIECPETDASSCSVCVYESFSANLISWKLAKTKYYLDILIKHLEKEIHALALQYQEESAAADRFADKVLEETGVDLKRSDEIPSRLSVDAQRDAIEYRKHWRKALALEEQISENWKQIDEYQSELVEMADPAADEAFETISQAWMGTDEANPLYIYYGQTIPWTVHDAGICDIWEEQRAYVLENVCLTDEVLRAIYVLIANIDIKNGYEERPEGEIVELVWEYLLLQEVGRLAGAGKVRLTARQALALSTRIARLELELRRRESEEAVERDQHWEEWKKENLEPPSSLELLKAHWNGVKNVPGIAWDMLEECFESLIHPCETGKEMGYYVGDLIYDTDNQLKQIEDSLNCYFDTRSDPETWKNPDSIEAQWEVETRVTLSLAFAIVDVFGTIKAVPALLRQFKSWAKSASKRMRGIADQLRKAGVDDLAHKYDQSATLLEDLADGDGDGCLAQLLEGTRDRQAAAILADAQGNFRLSRASYHAALELAEEIDATLPPAAKIADNTKPLKLDDLCEDVELSSLALERATEAGLTRPTFRALWEFAQRTNTYIIVRYSNACWEWLRKKNFMAKPHDCMAKSCKNTKYQGIVTNPKHPHQKALWEADIENSEVTGVTQADYDKAVDFWERYAEGEPDANGNVIPKDERLPWAEYDKTSNPDGTPGEPKWKSGGYYEDPKTGVIKYVEELDGGGFHVYDGVHGDIDIQAMYLLGDDCTVTGNLLGDGSNMADGEVIRWQMTNYIRMKNGLPPREWIPHGAANDGFKQFHPPDSSSFVLRPDGGEPIFFAPRTAGRCLDQAQREAIAIASDAALREFHHWVLGIKLPYDPAVTGACRAARLAEDPAVPPTPDDLVPSGKGAGTPGE